MYFRFLGYVILLKLMIIGKLVIIACCRRFMIHYCNWKTVFVWLCTVSCDQGYEVEYKYFFFKVGLVHPVAWR
jgi:hypothetical protein